MQKKICLGVVREKQEKIDWVDPDRSHILGWNTPSPHHLLLSLVTLTAVSHHHNVTARRQVIN